MEATPAVGVATAAGATTAVEETRKTAPAVIKMATPAEIPPLPLADIAIDLAQIEGGLLLMQARPLVAGGGLVITIRSGGTAVVVGAPAIAVGGVMVVGGTTMAGYGAWNLGKDVQNLHWNNEATGSSSAEAPKPQFQSTGSGDSLRRTTEVDGEKWQSNTGHGFNREHVGPGDKTDLRTSTLTQDDIETTIIGDVKSFKKRGSAIPCSGTSAGKENHYVDVGGTKDWISCVSNT